MTITDLESTNGTVVDSGQLKAGQFRPVHDRSEIVLGSCVLMAKLGAERSETSDGTVWILSGFDEDGKVFQYPVSSHGANPGVGDHVELATLSRAPNKDCVLNHSSVSRRHAALLVGPRPIGSALGCSWS
ncbi:hypothetical protein [Breoghania sp.]|uniref:hypothetical protein n=1 Tax=Breoghania sp. TaxID=2065378 RepID=UPI0026115009|nr:hypothetical protein [Breoghania sp.]MDJ0930650.1 hypothetical protein [Breoghania sp.]